MNEPKHELHGQADGSLGGSSGRRDSSGPRSPEAAGDRVEAGLSDSDRHGVGRSKTLSPKQMARDLRRRRQEGQTDPEEEELIRTIGTLRPRKRADCIHTPRPCLFVSCKHNLYLDVNPETGSIKLNFPDKEIWELAETCALDVADKGGITLEEVGAIMNLTRERIRQVETHGLIKLREATDDEPKPRTSSK
jgi:hypothetical protein